MNRSRTEELEVPSLSVYIYMFKEFQGGTRSGAELREGSQCMHASAAAAAKEGL